MTIDDSILRHYEAIDERGRLSGRAGGELEYARTRAILSRSLPPAPARILDVGGAAGRYASPLAADGYEVTLIDPVPHHVAQATATGQIETAPFEAVEGDARMLPRPDRSVDAVLFLGPLYHLDRDGRTQALAEAHRVLRPGGVLVAAAITRFASMLDALRRGWLADGEFMQIVERDLATGCHVNPDPVGKPQWFTTAWFHRPEELREEVGAAGFAVGSLLAVEGPVALLSDLEQRWADPDERQRLLDAIEAIESESSLLGASLHFIAVATA